MYSYFEQFEYFLLYAAFFTGSKMLDHNPRSARKVDQQNIKYFVQAALLLAVM